MTENKGPEFDPTEVRDVSVEVYKERLGAADLKKMLEKDNDGGKKLRSRAASYDSLTRAYMRVLRERAERNRKMERAS